MKCLNLRVCIITIVALTLLSVSSVFAQIFKKAEPMKESTNFVEGSIMRPRGNIPFHRAWEASQVDFSKFTEIYIAPINTEYLLENSWWKDLNHKKAEDNIDDVADYMHRTIKRAYFMDPRKRFKVVRDPGPKTLVLEIAIVELVPNKAGFSILMSAAGPAAGSLAVSALGGVAKKVGSTSTIAIEVRLRDGGDGAIVGMIADREQKKGSIVNVKDFTWYGPVQTIIKEWGDQFVQIAHMAPNDIIADTPAFSFKPW